MSFFEELPTYPEDPILGLETLYQKDEREEKINLILGTYQHHQKRFGGILSVKKAESLLVEEERNKFYLSIEGEIGFLEEMRKMVLGNHVTQKQICELQTLGGTGALHVGALLIKASEKINNVYVPNITWSNHIRIFHQVGLNVLKLSYYDEENKAISSSFLKDLDQIEEGSLILLQTCCQNPTGTDLTHEMWKEVCTIVQKKKLVIFFDTAYQGFDQGIEEDRYPITLCLELGIPFIVASCCSKNFSLYGERVGYFASVGFSHHETLKISNYLKEKIRGEYSTPPRRGALIVSTIMQNPYLKQEWEGELSCIRESLRKKREEVVQILRKHIGHSWDYILNQKGFFGYPSFSQSQVTFLRQEKGIYITSGGRFNLNGINEKNIDYIAKSFSEVYENL